MNVYEHTVAKTLHNSNWSNGVVVFFLFSFFASFFVCSYQRLFSAWKIKLTEFAHENDVQSLPDFEIIENSILFLLFLLLLFFLCMFVMFINVVWWVLFHNLCIQFNCLIESKSTTTAHCIFNKITFTLFIDILELQKKKNDSPF